MKTKNRIKEFREMKGFSKKEFATMCGITPSHLSNIERGYGHFSLPVLLNIHAHLDCTLDELFRFDEYGSDYIQFSIKELSNKERALFIELATAMKQSIHIFGNTYLDKDSVIKNVIKK